MENKYYIYCYLDTRKPGRFSYDGLDFCFLYEPFYIGKGCGDRWTDHTREVVNGYKPTNKIRYSKISKMINEGFYPLVSILKENLNLEESYIEEINLISKIGRIDMKNGTLTNLTSGGDGGREVSKITRDYFSKLFTGEGNPMFGVSRYGKENPFYQKKHTYETKSKISEMNKGRIPWNKGKKYEAVSGEKSNFVIDYTIISPEGEVFNIKSCHFSDFCKRNKLSERNLKRYKNKGKIPPYKKNRNLPLRINTTGWEFITN